MEFILSTSTFLSFFLFIRCINKIKEAKAKNLFLALFLLAIGTQIGLFILSRNFDNLISISYLRTIFPFAYGPLIYFYIYFLSYPNKKSKTIYWLHFIPVILIALFEVYYLLSENYNPLEISKRPFFHLAKYLVISSILVYIIFGLQVLKRYQKSLFNRYSYTEKIDLNWLNKFLYSFLICSFLG